MNNFRPEIECPVAGAGGLCRNKRWRDLSLAPDLSPQLPEGGGGSPVGSDIGGEVCEEEDVNSLRRLSHGSMSVIGRQRVMEDAVTVVPGMVAGEFLFLAVYDGHGGSRVANACRDRLHQILVKELEGPAGGGGSERGGVRRGVEWEKVMRACFTKMDEEVNGSSGGGSDGKRKTVGSTAVVVVMGKEEVVVANCGVSRVVLGRGGVAVPLSEDHKVILRRYYLFCDLLSLDCITKSNPIRTC
ncbi:hypothetical protein Acr_00g0022970 [Actinidia rufa]|uniref:protein-serine/threonine phosphatase n=1 Tax=Actinidia rufa TaxID=165716 RepID=A0A7J0DDA5_9ERIC|nr:hypothetical protein Acr_00g0022970 [Actinidia rufa]